MMFLGEVTAVEMDWIKGAMLALPTIASAITAYFVISGRASAPQPFRVQGETRMATWEELQTIRHDVNSMRSDIEKTRTELIEMERRMQTEGSRRAANIHRRIEEMDKDIDAIPGRVVAMFKDTKGLL